MAGEDRYQIQMHRLRAITERDCSQVVKKNREYNQSWLRRGGVGAFMMLCRKWDRIEPAVEERGWDIFHAIKMDVRDEGILDDIRDLRNYLLLVEEEMMHRGVVEDILGKSTSKRVETSDSNRSGVGMIHPFGYDPDLDNAPGAWRCSACGTIYSNSEEGERYKHMGQDICAACKVSEEIYAGKKSMFK